MQILCALLLTLNLLSPQQVPETVAITLSPDTPALIMPAEDARAMYERLKSHKETLTPLEERWYAALVVSLGVIPLPDTYLDCSGLSYTERMRIEMGSRYEVGKCVRRAIKNKTVVDQ